MCEGRCLPRPVSQPTAPLRRRVRATSTLPGRPFGSGRLAPTSLEFRKPVTLARVREQKLQPHLRTMICAGLLTAAALQAESALAHDCAVIDEPDGVAKLFKDNTVANKLVVRADLMETDTVYVATTRNATVATVAPMDLVAHHGEFDFTGVGVGKTVIDVHWSYAPTMAEGDCEVPIEVILMPLTFDPADDPLLNTGCGCCRVVLGRPGEAADSAMLWTLLIFGVALQGRLRRRRRSAST